MKLNKSKGIEKFYNTPFNSLIIRFYLNDSMSSVEIAEKIYKDTGVKITARYIQLVTKKLGVSRNYSQAFKLAIKVGRKSYKHLKKSIKSSELRHGISLATRYAVMKRDNFKCLICGKDSRKSQLVIDHIIPVVRGGTNDIINLRTLCRACNHGKMIYENEK